MSNLHELSQRLMALDDRITACMKCGMCQAVCPMYGASGMEADVARGKLALIDNLAHEMIQDPEAVADKLGRCLLCGSCQAACPPGVQIMDVFMEARELVKVELTAVVAGDGVRNGVVGTEGLAPEPGCCG